jgi:protein-tyrosine phosphatase
MAGVRIAMVCLGNICRSPMAAAVAGAMVEQAGLSHEVEVESFGTGGYHAGEGADPKAVAALRRRGWPAEGHRARRLDAADVERADLLLCADRHNLADVRRLAGAGAGAGKVRLLRSYDPTTTEGEQDVPDPWGGRDVDFDRTLELIERACRGLVDELARALRR